MNKQRMLELIKNNKIIRSVLYPANVLYRKSLLKRYSRSEDAHFIKRLCDKHKGERCFIIGNGPSLRPSDLDQLKKEYSFATNRIYCIFDRTDWRPTYYMCTDANVIADEIENIKSIETCPKLINYKASVYGRKASDNIWYVFLNGKFHINPLAVQVDSLSNDASKYLSWVHTVTINAVEMAIYMGFKEIYLLGVDNSYMLTRSKDGKMNLDPNIKADHFEGMTSSDGKVHQGKSYHAVDSVNREFELAKKYADEHGIKIYNATRGGKLEVFERVDFDELMAKE